MEAFNMYHLSFPDHPFMQSCIEDQQTELLTQDLIVLNGLWWCV